MSWILLVLAGILEIAWAVGLKYTHGFRNPIPSVLVIAAISASIYLLALAVRHIPIGVAYAVWVGIGAAGTILAGAVFHHESLSLQKGIWLGLLCLSILGLKLAR